MIISAVLILRHKNALVRMLPVIDPDKRTGSRGTLALVGFFAFRYPYDRILHFQGGAEA